MSGKLLQDIQRAAAYGDVILTNHGEYQGSARNVTERDVCRAIKTATFAKDQGEGRTEVGGGVDWMNAPLTIICKLIREGLLVITVFGERHEEK